MLIQWYMVDKLVLCGFYLCHDAFASVAEHQQGHMQCSIVDGGLVEDLLREVYGWRFKLDEHQGLHLSVIDDSVATLLHTSYLNRHLYRYKVVRIPKLIYQQLKRCLSHQFLWRETDVSPSPRTKDILFAVLSSYIHTH